MPPENDLLQELEQLEQRYAENPEGLVFAHLADAYRKLGDFAKAEGLVTYGLKNHPTYISGHNVLGRIYHDSGRYGEAHEQFSKVLDLDPHNLIALRALGDLALKEGQLEDARSWYERILAIDPRNEQAQDGLAALEAGGPEAEQAAEPADAPAAEAAAPDEPGEMPGIDLEIDEALDDIERSLDVEAAAAEMEVKGTEALGPVEGFDQVEGLVNKETMSRSDNRVIQDPTVESASKLADKEFLGDGSPAGDAAMPWDDASDSGVEDQAAGMTAELDAAPAAPEAGDVFTESTVDGLAAGEPAFDLLSEGEPMDFDLEGIEDWTPGFLQGDAPAAEQAEVPPGEGASIGDADGDFSIDFGDTGPAETPSSEAPAETPVDGGKGLVTETMAELYVDQGLFDEALRVYRQLADDRPGDGRLAARITELEQRVETAAAPASSSFDLGDLLELTEPRIPSDVDAEAAPEPAPPAEPVAPEPVAVAEPSFAEETTESSAQEPIVSDVGEFTFEDEAPVAGFEHLDPFAASFEIMAKRDGAEEPAAHEPEPEAAAPAFEAAAPVATEDWEVSEPADVAPAAEPEPVLEPMPTEPIEFEAEPEPTVIEFVEPPEPVEPQPTPAVAEPIAFEEPSEPEPTPIMLEPEPAFGVVEPVEPELPPERSIAEPVALQTPSEPADVEPLGEITDLEPVELEPVGEETLGLQPVGMEPLAPETIAEEPEAQEAISIPSIEDYLSGLLTYKPGEGKAGKEPTADAKTPAQEAAQTGPPQADSAAGGDDEDLEQFQEWLKGLRT